MARGRSDIEECIDITEAEKHLNFNLLPDSKTQKKMDYLLTPYNKSKNIQKHMCFEDDEIETDSLSNQKVSWNTISKLILSKNKKNFRKTLLCINNKLYDDIVKQTVQRSKSIHKRGEFKKSGSSVRGSIMTNIVQEFRQFKQTKGRNYKEFSPNVLAKQLISRYFKSSKKIGEKDRYALSSTASTVKKDKKKKSIKQDASSLKCIPEASVHKICVNKATKSYSDLNLIKRISESKEKDQKELLESLLQRKHSIFSKTASSIGDKRDPNEFLKTEWYNIQERGDEDSVSDESGEIKEPTRKDSLPIKLQKHQISYKHNINQENMKNLFCQTERKLQINPNYQMMSAETDSSEKSINSINKDDPIQEYGIENPKRFSIFRPDLLQIQRIRSPSVRQTYTSPLKSPCSVNHKGKMITDTNLQSKTLFEKYKAMQAPILKKRYSMSQSKGRNHIMEFV